MQEDETAPNTRRTTEIIAGWVQEAIESDPLTGEDTTYDVGLTIGPGPNGQAMPLIIVVLTVPSPVLGQGISGTLMIPSMRPERRSIEESVRSTLEGLRAERSKAIAQSLAQGNGHVAPGPSGLIIPGR